MSTAVWTNRLELNSVADAALKAAVRFWMVVVVIGQLLFASTVASFYGIAALHGNLQAWNRFMARGYVSGDTAGHVAVGVHIGSAVIIILAGMLQLAPQIRNRFPAFHRWNGRLYLVSAFSISLAGLFMMWMRGSAGDVWQHLGTSLMAVLIMLCAVMAARYAIARDFKTHRRWALRLYLVVSASLFIRAGIFLSLLVNRGPFGFDSTSFTGPFLTFISFAQYLVPLAVLELYFRVQERPGTIRRMGMAAGLFVLSLGLAAGIFAVSIAVWVPEVKAAFDTRKPIGETLSATIAARGMDTAVQQYHELNTAGSAAAYNFDENQLNTLGYTLLREKKYAEAIRIFQLNVEAYPQSANVYDSLGEGYMDAGDKVQAIANYRKSLELNPKNSGAVAMLQKLGAP
jgi:tetratricopeptide (TPR) repeat protein